MTNRETMELFIEKNGQETVAYPFVEKDHVVFGNGMGIEEVIEQDISMPTVTHEEVSFKVGVGDQDVSSSVVDSSVGEMVIKGQTYHNILPEPSTHVLTNNKEMFKVNEGLDPNVEIVDGVSKSAILKGNTIKNYKNNLFDNVLEKGAISISTGETNDLNLNCYRTANFIPINGNFKIAKYGIDGDLHVCFYNSNKSFISAQTYVLMQTSEGNVIVTPPTNCSFIKFYNPYDNNEPTGEFGFGVMAENEIVEFEIQSVKMPVLTTTGKNLFDGKLIDGYINSTTGQVVSGSSTRKVTDYIKIKNNTQYISSGFTYTSCWEYDKNKQPIKQQPTNPFISSDNAKYVRFTINSELEYNQIQIEEGSVATSYEPYKSNILTSSEDVVLRGIGDVQDELNLLTGEVVQNIGEIVLDGSESWTMKQGSTGDYNYFYLSSSNSKVANILPSSTVISDSYPYSKNMFSMTACVKTGSAERLQIRDDSVSTTSEFKNKLSVNNIKVCTINNEKSVKTVDLSSSGNWEKIVFNGSENWRVYPRSSSVNFVNTIAFQTNTIPNAISTENYQLFSESFRTTSHYASDVEGIFMKGTMRLSIKKSKLMSQDVDGLKQYLQQNPLTVWYQTVVHQDPTQVKQPIFFKDGHIQLSSGADNSLIPTLNYQAKTSNSYVMDLMKANTRYTMKAKSASGTFTIDGTSYGAGTNGTFTTPSSMTNKFLVMSDKTHEEVMIIEGDVTDKTIPYFKGIKSAFEDEDKIEVLSTGKNLFNAYKHKFDTSSSPGLRVEVLSSNSIRTYCTDTIAWRAAFVVYQLEPHTWYNIRCEVTGNGSKQLDINIPEYGTSWNPNTVNCTQSNSMLGKFLTDKSGKVKLSFQGSGEQSISYDNTYTNIQIEKIQEKSTVHSFYEPYKANNTKIPLLSPLRSLPNGVKDEIILDRENHKAKIIQRVAKIVLNGSEAWHWSKDNNKNSVFYTQVDDILKINGDSDNIISNTFANQMSFNVDREGIWFNSMKYILIGISKEKLNGIITRDEMKRWVSKNPITVHYQLNTPIITEIDLEGFPYIYKDGHIFLNSEIAPNTQITYSISQQHQISASTQDLIRHEQELVYLYKLIAQYIQVDYQSTLLSLDLKLK